MKICYLIIREILHRKLNFILGLLAIVTAVSLFISFFTTGQASRRETTRIMRDIGFNIRIISKNTDMEKFWISGFSEYTMPESSVNDLSSLEGLSYAHLTAVLQKKVIWRGRETILTGIAPEVSPPGKKKSPMVFSIRQGTVYIGFEPARNLRLKNGDEIDIFNKTFTIAHCLSESGSDDDIRIYAHLHDVQELLDMKNKINEIKALQCLCLINGKNTNSITILKEQLARVLPEAKVILMESIASAREQQRLMAEEYFGFIMPFVLVVSMAWIGILAFINVRERRREIGILRALGFGSGEIALLFLGKAIVIGLIGAAVGFGIGTGLALKYGNEIFKVTSNMIKPAVGLFYWSLIASPAFCAISVFMPVMFAVTQDPAIILREE